MNSIPGVIIHLTNMDSCDLSSMIVPIVIVNRHLRSISLLSVSSCVCDKKCPVSRREFWLDSDPMRSTVSHIRDQTSIQSVWCVVFNRSGAPTDHRPTCYTVRGTVGRSRGSCPGLVPVVTGGSATVGCVMSVGRPGPGISHTVAPCGVHRCILSRTL